MSDGWPDADSRSDLNARGFGFGDAATIAKRVHVAKCIFSRARRWKLVPENPFEHLRAGPQSYPDRAFCVRPKVAQRIIDQCPCQQWRAIIALSRFAGLTFSLRSL